MTGGGDSQQLILFFRLLPDKLPIVLFRKRNKLIYSTIYEFVILIS